MTIHKEGFIVIIVSYAVLALLGYLLYHFFGTRWYTWPFYTYFILHAIFTVCFFRNPARELHIEEAALIAPADGKIVIVEERFVEEYLGEPRIQVSIFMSIFNVHLNRYPIGGKVLYSEHHNGHFHVASHPKSSELHEHTTIVVDYQGTPILFRQIAGLIARRIVCYAKEGQMVQQGDEAGFIRFGSRVDIMLPIGSEINVKVGQKVKGGQTVIGRLPKGQDLK